MLIPAGEHARRGVHIVFSGDPELGSFRMIRGVRLIPLADLIRMKLTSYHLKDQTHLKDLEEAGLITADIADSLPAVLRERLERVRSQE